MISQKILSFFSLKNEFSHSYFNYATENQMKILSFFSLKSEFSHCYFNYATIFYSEKCVFLYRLQLCFGYHLKKKVQTLIIILIMVMKNENVLDYWYGK